MCVVSTWLRAAGLAALAFSSLTSRAAETAAVAPVNGFGLSCLRLTNGNALLSPWSLEQGLGMAYAGAGGATRTAVGKALGYPGDGVAVMEAFRELGEVLREKDGAAPQGKGLKSANRFFNGAPLKLKEDWQKQVRATFSAEAQALDFSHGDEATKTINAWVNTETGGKIPAVIPAGQLNRNSRLVLVNALSFEMPWEELFTKELTKEREFQVEAAKSKTVPLMFKQHRLRYARREGFQIAALPYAGGRFQFVVILPDAVDGLAAVEARLTPQLLAECAVLPLAEVRLSLPRLRMEPPAVAMKPLLTRLGMGPAFGAGADFRGISNEPLVIDEVFHRTFLEMDEDGTKRPPPRQSS